MKLSTEQRMQAYRVLIGEALAEQRKTKKLSQQAVADKTGTSRVSISYYENGLRSINTDELFTLCTACGFDAVKIMNNAYNASDGDLQKAYTKYFDRAMSLK